MSSRAMGPQDPLEVRLKDIWRQVLDVQAVELDDSFLEIGDSLEAVTLLAEINRVFGKDLPAEILLESSTVRQLAAVLREDTWSPPGSALVKLQPGGHKTPFFFVPPAGATLTRHAAEWVEHLDPSQPWYGLLARGLRENDPPPVTRVEEMATDYVQDIQALQASGPYLVGGECFGGIVAFEIAQQLLAKGEKVSLLAMMDSGRPNNGRRARRKSGSFNGWGDAALLLRKGGRYLLRRGRRLNRMRERDEWKDALRRVPQGRRMLHVFDAHVKARKNYVPQTYPGRITLFLSEERASKRTIEAQWSELAQGGLDCHIIPGTAHGEIGRGPHTRILAEKLKTCLDAAQPLA